MKYSQPPGRTRITLFFTRLDVLCVALMLLGAALPARAAIVAGDLQRLYVTYFGRPADPVGLAYWLSVTEAATAGGQSDDAILDSLANTFGSSTEYTSQFAGLNSDGIINKIYLNMFGHAPDPSGLLYWSLKLSSGALTLAQISRAIGDSMISAGNADGMALTNKVTAASAFTEAVDTTDEIMGYSGTVAYDRARAWLTGITDVATLNAALAPAALNASISAVIQPANVPTISSLTGPTNGSYRAGQTLDFTVQFSAPVTVTGQPRLSLLMGSTSTNATYTSGSGTTALVFRYIVQPGDTDTDGISSATPLVLNGGTIRNGATDAVLTFAPPNTAAVLVDTTPPTISLGLPSPDSTSTGPVSYQVTYGDAAFSACTLAPSDLTLNQTGTATGTVLVTGSGLTRTVTITNITGSGTLSISIDAGTASDLAGNLAPVAGSSATFTVTSAGGEIPPSGNVVAWGDSMLGQTTAPTGLTGVSAVSAGSAHTVALTIPDGNVVAWGDSMFGQTTVPAGLTGVSAVSCGSAHTVALMTNGTVVAWGFGQFGQTNVPPGLINVTAVAAGYQHVLALKNDGNVVAWGDNTFGQRTVPPDLSGVKAVAGGWYHSLAATSNGTVVAWGDFMLGQTAVPAGLSGVVAVAAGAGHSLALKNDGTVVAWGMNDNGQTNVPVNLTGVKAIAAGGWHSLALLSNGTVVAWGSGTSIMVFGGPPPLHEFGQAMVPAGLSNVVAIAAGEMHSVALVSAALPLPDITNVTGPTNGSYRAGQVLDFTVQFSAPVTVTGQPRLPLVMGSTSTNATYTSGSGTTALVFTCIVQPGDTDTDGISSASPLVLNGGTIRNGTTDAALTFTPPNTTAVLVDTTPPTISLGLPSPDSTSTGPVSYQVTYGDAAFSACTLAPGDLTLNQTGTATGTVLVTGSGLARTVTITNITGSGTLGISIAVGTASDLAGNLAPAAGPSATFTVVPANNAPMVTVPITDFAVNEDAANVGVNLTTIFSDAETPAASLVYALVANTNTALVTATITQGTNLTLAFAASGNGTSRISVSATDAGGLSATNTFVVTVNAVNDAPSFTLQGSVVFAENFDGVTATNLPAGWTKSVLGAGAKGTNWVTATTSSDTPPNAVVVVGSATRAEYRLDSPPFVLGSGGTLLSFRHWFDTEFNKGDKGGCDGGVLEIAIADGSFTNLLAAGGVFLQNGYNYPIKQGTDNIFMPGGTMCWSSNSGGFITTKALLPGAAGQSVRLRWRFGLDNGDDSHDKLPSLWMVDSMLVGPSITVLPGNGLVTSNNFLVNLSPGPANEAGQTVSVIISNDNSSLFSQQPNMDGAGNLTFAPVASASGTANVTVTAKDSGGTAYGGVDSYIQTFTVMVLSNAAPRVAFAKTTVAVPQGAGPQTLPSFATFIAGPTYEAGQTMLYSVTTANAGLFSAPPAIDTNGILTFTPAADQSGSTTVKVVVQDSGGTACGGVDKSTNTFTLAMVPSQFLATNTAGLTAAIAASSNGTIILISGNVTLSGVITKNVTLVTGNGVSLTGRLNVGDGGTVNLGGGTFPGASILVRSGGTLSGGGAFTGPLFVLAGGILSPGTSPGTISAGSGTWDAGGNYDWEITDAGGAPGTADLLEFTGALTNNATAANPFIVRVKTLNANSQPGAMANFDPRFRYIWTIAQADSLVGFNAGALSLDTTGVVNSTAGGAFAIQQSGGVVQLTFTPPAPVLTIRPGSGSVTLSWAEVEMQYLLESATTLDPSGFWTDLLDQPTITNGTNHLTMPILPAAQFYRLKIQKP